MDIVAFELIVKDVSPENVLEVLELAKKCGAINMTVKGTFIHNGDKKLVLEEWCAVDMGMISHFIPTLPVHHAGKKEILHYKAPIHMHFWA